ARIPRQGPARSSSRRQSIWHEPRQAAAGARDGLAGWETQGFAGFSGTGIYRLELEIGDEAEWVLELPEVHTVVAALLD
ncbi:hypothetical protein AB9E34_34010, partial [Rhizobium leguminosarum]|uniref:hypothetical protein n=1 Tax=Rhizobium leguminosarum TaxID=384 RepID=UPI003F98E732